MRNIIEKLTCLTIFILTNPIFLIKVLKVGFVIDSYMLTTFFALISTFFILVFLGSYIKLKEIIKILFIPYLCLLILFFFLFISENITKTLLKKNKSYTAVTSENYLKLFNESYYSGYELSSNFHDTIYKLSEKDTIFNFLIETDSFGRRKIYNNNKKDKNHLIFFGCSYTFGDGVNNSKICPQLIKNLVRENFSVYNYGVPGYGTQQMLTKLQFGNIEKEIFQENGIAIYTYVPGIIPRNIGAFSTFGWSNVYPCYILENEELVYYSSTKKAFPLRSKIFRFLNHFNTTKFLKYNINLDYPNVNEKHIELTVKMIKESEKLYLKKFPNSKFYVLVYPALHREDPNTILLKQSLINNNLNILDLSKFGDNINNKTIPFDGHPTEFFHKLVTEKLLTLLIDENKIIFKNL